MSGREREGGNAYPGRPSATKIRRPTQWKGSAPDRLLQIQYVRADLPEPSLLNRSRVDVPFCGFCASAASSVTVTGGKALQFRPRGCRRAESPSGPGEQRAKARFRWPESPSRKHECDPVRLPVKFRMEAGFRSTGALWRHGEAPASPENQIPGEIPCGINNR
jgi:hypothetical protein